MNKIVVYSLATLIGFFLVTHAIFGQDYLNTLEKKFTAYKNNAPKERVLILSDRDIYAPGDLLWFNVTAFDIFSPSVSAKSINAKVYLVNNSSKEIISNDFSLKEGNGNGALKIPNDIDEGVYYLCAETTSSDKLHYLDKKIVIKNSILPPFLIKVILADKILSTGDEFDMSIEFTDYYNEPVRNLDYILELFDGSKKIKESTGKGNKAGMAAMKMKVPSKLNSGMLAYRITAEKKGAESILFSRIPVITDQIFIDFYPEGGHLFDGLASTVQFYAYDCSGSPIALQAELLVDGKVTMELISGTDGIGSFQITPNIGKVYKVKIREPFALDKNFDLPPIQSQGIGIREAAHDINRVSYQLSNAYRTALSVYIVGVSEGEIFWKSEHEIDREMLLDIDISKAKGLFATITVFNANGGLESEIVAVISPEQNAAPIMVSKEPSSLSRGENQLEIQHLNGPGTLIFKAVHTPWLISHLNDANADEMLLPYDIGNQIVFRSREFRSLDFKRDIGKYRFFYVPYGFSWDKVLNAKELFRSVSANDLVNANTRILAQLTGQYLEEKSNGFITQSNMLSEPFFATSNTKYVADLYKKKKDDIPYYKKMLADGIPVMDVLQAIKPYSLQGNNIIFVGSAISISSQGGSLIVIDGITSGTDASVLRNISPYDVESIFVSTQANDIQKYTGFNTVGLIEVTLKDGKDLERQMDKVEKNTKFSAPTYTDTKKGIPNDFRATLYWTVIELDKQDTQASISYYNSDLYSNVKCMVYFITLNKIPATISYEYQVK